MSIEPDSTAITPVETRLPFHRTLSWRAILAGTVAGLAVHLLLTLLGIGIGAGILDPLTDENPIEKFSTGAAVAWGVSALISLFVGGWVAGRFVPNGYKSSGCLHGFLVWSVAAIAMFGVVSTTTGVAIGGAAKVVGHGLEAAGKSAGAAAGASADLAEDAIQQNTSALNSFVDEALQSRPEDANRAGTVRAKREISYATARLFTMEGDASSAENRAALSKILVEQAGMNEEEANRTVSEWSASYERLKTDLKAAKEKAEQKAREAADTASKALAHAATWTFLAFLLGAAAASIGGKCGACYHRREDEPSLRV